MNWNCFGWLIFSLLVFSGCNCDQSCYDYRVKDHAWYSKNGKLKVLVTTAMIEDVVKGVGGDFIDTSVLVKGELNPHSYQLVKGDDEKFGYARLIFYNGLGLEHGPSLRKQLEMNPKAFAVGDAIQKRYPDRILKHQGQVDPHIWMDISLWAEMIPFVTEVLAQHDPAHAKQYQANGELLYEELADRHELLKRQLAKVPEQKRYLVTSHDAFNYFARAYLATDQERANHSWAKRFVAPEGLAPESQISAKDIQEIIDHIRQYQIEVIFPESNVSKDSIRKIVEAGKNYGLPLHIAKIYLYGDAIGKSGSDGDSYLKMMKHNGTIISGYLNGEFQE